MALPLINGINYSSANVQIMIPLLGAVIGVTNISYSKEQTIDDNYGLGQDAVSRGYGQNKYTGRISMYYDIVKRLIALAPNKDLMQIPPFDIVVTYSGANVPFTKDVLRAVNFKNIPVGIAAGDTKISVDIDLAVGNIDYSA